MADSFTFAAEPRSHLGKGPVRRLRRLDQVPATVYGGGKAPESIVLAQKDILKALKQEAVFSRILTLHIGNGEAEKVIIKDLQRHYSKPRVMHMDFQRIRATEKIAMKIPIHFLGEAMCPGVKAGGVISHSKTDVEISCLPADLPEFIEVDVSQLQLGQSIHLMDLQLPTGVELATAIHDEAHNLPVVSVAVPKVSKEDLAAEAAEAAKSAEAAAAAGGVAPAAGGAAPAAPAQKPAEGEAKAAPASDTAKPKKES